MADCQVGPTLVMVSVLALLPMTPILQTLPAEGPRPPEISTRWLQRGESRRGGRRETRSVAGRGGESGGE